MSRLIRLRSGSSLDLLGLIVLGSLVVAIAFLALIIAPLVSLYRHPPTVSTEKRDAAGALAKFRSSINQQVAIVDNRSWFFDPKPPDQTPGKTNSAIYSGPSLIAYIDGTAWFSDGSKLSDKEPKSSSLKLIQANPPWGVTVEWGGGKYDVELFKKSTAASLRDTLSSNIGYSFPAVSTSTRPSGHGGSDHHDLPSDARSGPGVTPAAPAAAAAETAHASQPPDHANQSPERGPPPPEPAGGPPQGEPPPQPGQGQPNPAPPPPSPEPSAAASPKAPTPNPIASTPAPAPADSAKEPVSKSPPSKTAAPSHT